MLKTLKLKGQETDFFFVSDLHHGHDRSFLWGKRANPLNGETYTNVTDHDNGTIQAWNSVCDSRSIVFNLGDICFNDSEGTRFWTLMRRLWFKEHVVMLGNHSSGHKVAYLAALKAQHPGAFEMIKGQEELVYEVYPLRVSVDGDPGKHVIFMPQYMEVSINSTPIVLCHYPIISHNNMARNALMISGHSHNACSFTNKDTGTGFRLDVGLESFGRPISLKEVKHHLRNRTIDSHDHHGETPPA